MYFLPIHAMKARPILMNFSQLKQLYISSKFKAQGVLIYFEEMFYFLYSSVENKIIYTSIQRTSYNTDIYIYNRQTDRQTDRQADRQTDRQIEGQTDILESRTLGIPSKESMITGILNGFVKVFAGQFI